MPNQQSSSIVLCGLDAAILLGLMYSWLPPRGAAQAPQRQPWRRSFAPLLRTLGAGAKLSLTCFWALTTIRAAVYGRGLRCGRPRPAPWFATVCALVCHGLRLGLPRPAPWFATACAWFTAACALVCHGLRLGLPRPAPWFATACAWFAAAWVADWAVDGHGPKFCVPARAVVEGHSLGLL